MDEGAGEKPVRSGRAGDYRALRAPEGDVEDQLEQIVYDAHSRNARDLANWWEDHQEADRKREKEEAARKKRKNLRQQALEKLTPAERKALGVK